MVRTFSILGAMLCCGLVWPQTSGDEAVVVNSREANWQHDPDDPPGGESLTLRTDKKTGATEFFAKYPAGYESKPHTHKVNERLLLTSGQMSVETGGKKTVLDAGGFAYVPAGQMHRISCVSAVPCVWYLAWDGKQ